MPDASEDSSMKDWHFSGSQGRRFGGRIAGWRRGELGSCPGRRREGQGGWELLGKGGPRGYQEKGREGQGG
jgi:hypothetical protein